MNRPNWNRWTATQTSSAKIPKTTASGGYASTQSTTLRGNARRRTQQRRCGYCSAGRRGVGHPSDQWRRHRRDCRWRRLAHPVSSHTLFQLFHHADEGIQTLCSYLSVTFQGLCWRPAAVKGLTGLTSFWVARSSQR